MDSWEYWDPKSDSYKCKRSGKNASNKDVERRNSEPIPGSSAKDSDEDSEAESWEYWDPKSYSYKRKRSGRNTSDKGVERRNSEPIPGSSTKKQ